MPHILVMEDDIDLAFRLRTLLEGEGHDVQWSRNATDAMGALAETDFDLVISDIIIRENGEPVADGGIKLIGFIRIKRSEKTLKTNDKVPILAITGAINRQYNPELLNLARQVGADRTMAKPFADLDFLKCVDGLLPQHNKKNG